MKKSTNGFTLVELLIVVAIIAILAALVFALSQSQIFKGTDAKKKADLDKIKIALEEYEKDHNCYPQQKLLECKPDSTGLVPYLNNIPCDPVTNEKYFYEPESVDCPSWFHVYAVLQNTKDKSVTPGIGPLGAFNYAVSSSNAPLLVSRSSGSGSSGPTPVATPDNGDYWVQPTGDDRRWGCIDHVCTELKFNTKTFTYQCTNIFDNYYCNGAGNCDRVTCQ